MRAAERPGVSMVDHAEGASGSAASVDAFDELPQPVAQTTINPAPMTNRMTVNSLHEVIRRAYHQVIAPAVGQFSPFPFAHSHSVMLGIQARCVGRIGGPRHRSKWIGCGRQAS